MTGPQSEQPASTLLLVTVTAATAALIANIYYAQPLILMMAADVHLRPAFGGGIVGTALMGYSIGLFLLVPLADVIENRRLVLSCGVPVLIGLVGLATAQSAALLIAAAAVMGIFSSVAQVLIPYLSHIVPERKRGRVLGIVMAAALAGVMLARPIALFVSATSGWRAIFWLSAALIAALGLALARMMPPRQPHGRMRYRDTIGSMFVLFRTEHRVRRRTLYQMLLFGAFNLFCATVPILLEERFGLGQAAIGLFALAGAGGVVAIPFAGQIADRGLTQVGTIGAALVMSLSFLCTMWAAEETMLPLLVIAAVLMYGGAQTSQTLSRLIVLEVAPDTRGRVNALFMALTIVGGAIGSAIGSVSYVEFGWNATALIGAGSGLVVMFLAIAEQRRASVVADLQEDA